MKTPDITPAQVVGLVGAVLNTLVEFGVKLTAGQQHAILADAAILSAIVIGDSLIRFGRSRNLVTVPAPAPDVVAPPNPAGQPVPPPTPTGPVT